MEAYEALLATLDDSKPEHEDVERNRDLQQARPAPLMRGGLISRLPILHLTEFSERAQDWLSFINMFVSLVNSRTDLPPGQKFACLLSCFSAEPRRLNTRRLADYFISENLNLLKAKGVKYKLRIDFLNSLLMATKSLERLGFPVGEWSYLLFHIATAKIPVQLKSRFEQKYSSDSRVLLTFDQLMEFLEEECRLLDDIPRDVQESSGNACRRVTVVPELKIHHHCDGNQTQNHVRFMR
ncbi:hypothetical protein EVAR_19316_1 [Eumeta japonica]|uniref:Uncharacterized protein n=1 Tax=Eumeta variegata TaxID=151549 RepID=A0A4C1UE83_EUMVA|nr:hypothetical protein EVAR_19316_1 [Eumeta japonica]